MNKTKKVIRTGKMLATVIRCENVSTLMILLSLPDLSALIPCRRFAFFAEFLWKDCMAGYFDVRMREAFTILQLAGITVWRWVYVQRLERVVNEEHSRYKCHCNGGRENAFCREANPVSRLSRLVLQNAAVSAKCRTLSRSSMSAVLGPIVYNMA